jgi:hypothetical protein
MIPTASYAEQSETWPSSGRHILAHFDDETIIVYQAYSPAIGRFAIEHGYFGGEFSYRRMSWIKTNFLWMMYRSDWGRSAGQEVVLAVRLRRSFFDSLLKRAVPSSYLATQFQEFKTEQHGRPPSSDLTCASSLTQTICRPGKSANAEPFSLDCGALPWKPTASERSSRLST